MFFTATTQKSGNMKIDIPNAHQSLVYLLEGEVLVNNEVTLKKRGYTIAYF